MWHLHSTTWFFYQKKERSIYGVEYKNCITLESIRRGKNLLEQNLSSALELEIILEKEGFLYGWKGSELILHTSIKTKQKEKSYNLLFSFCFVLIDVCKIILIYLTILISISGVLKGYP